MTELRDRIEPSCQVNRTKLGAHYQHVAYAQDFSFTLVAMIGAPDGAFCASTRGSVGKLKLSKVGNGELYNIVVCATSYNETSDEGWVVDGSPQDLIERFGTWEPRVQKLCKLTPQFMKRRLCDLPILSRWVHSTGKACILGDSSHPMLPYLAQGAAQAVEDAAAIRQCLASPDAAGPDGLKQALVKYKSIRLPRASLVQQKTRNHQYILHVEDGETQKQRDLTLRINGDENPVFWGDGRRRMWFFSHDAEVIDKEGANWKVAPGLPLVGAPSASTVLAAH